MNEFFTVLTAVIPVFGIALIGLGIRKLNWLTEEADHSLLRLNINILFPCLILDAAIGNPAFNRLSNLLLAPAVGFGTVALGLFLATFTRRIHGLRTRQEQGTFAVTVGIYNYGYVPLPLSLLLFDEKTAGVLFLHNVGVETAMWTLGVMILTGGCVKDWRKILNAPLVAIIIALVINGAGLHDALPGVARITVKWLGQCAIPMSLILIGAVIADYLSHFHTQWGLRVVGFAIVLRLLILPVLFLLLAKYLPASLELKRVIVLQAAMPAAVFPIVMSRHYNGDPPTALRVVLGTSIAGLITIPIWLRIGMRLIGSSTG